MEIPNSISYFFILCFNFRYLKYRNQTWVIPCNTLSTFSSYYKCIFNSHHPDIFNSFFGFESKYHSFLQRFIKSFCNYETFYYFLVFNFSLIMQNNKILISLNIFFFMEKGNKSINKSMVKTIFEGNILIPLPKVLVGNRFHSLFSIISPT